MNCLVLANPTKDMHQLEAYLSGQKLKFDKVFDPVSAIHQAQEINYDLVVTDATVEGMQIQNVIQLLYGCNPKCRIIVVSDSNSISLETSIRKEKIYYYHLNSFGMKDLTTAVSAALDLNRSENNLKSVNP